MEGGRDVATIETVQVAADFAAWLQAGRALLTERTSLDWRLADWLTNGRERYGEQSGFDFLADQLGIAPKQLRTAAKVAEAFPPSQRAADVTFEVHAKIAALPDGERLKTLRRASSEQWKEADAKRAVSDYRRQAAMFEDDDPERLATLIYRAWNAAQPDVRAIAFPLIQTAARNGYAIIDEEVVLDA